MICGGLEVSLGIEFGVDWERGELRGSCMVQGVC